MHSSVATCTAPCRCSMATQELWSRRYQFMRCNIVETRTRSSSRCRREVPGNRSAGRNAVAERRLSCKTVLEVNDNSGRQISGRLTFESKEPRLKLYAFDLSAHNSLASLFSSSSLAFVRCSPPARSRGPSFTVAGSMTCSE